MSRGTRNKMVWLFLAAVLFLPFDLGVATLVINNDKSLASMWAENLSESERVSAAGRIIDYPVAYRKELLRVVTPEVRTGIWRSAIDRYVRSHPGASDSQKKALSELRAYLTPTLFSGRPLSAEAGIGLTRVSDAVVQEIGREDSFVIMQSLGPEAPHTALPLATRFLASIAGYGLVRAELPDCDCSLQSDWCAYRSGNPEVICFNWADCIAWEGYPACGVFYMYPCDGLCQLNP